MRVERRLTDPRSHQETTPSPSAISTTAANAPSATTGRRPGNDDGADRPAGIAGDDDAQGLALALPGELPAGPEHLRVAPALAFTRWLLHRGQVGGPVLSLGGAAFSAPMRLVPRNTPPVSMRTLWASTSPSMRPLATMSRWPVAVMFPCTCPGHHHVAPAHVAAHGATFADDDGRPGLDRALDRAVDPERALGLQVAAHVRRAAQNIFNLIGRDRRRCFFLRAPCHRSPPGRGVPSARTPWIIDGFGARLRGTPTSYAGPRRCGGSSGEGLPV